VTAALVVALASLAAGPEVSVQTLGGETIAGELVSLADEGLELVAADGPRQLPLAELLSLAPTKSPDAVDARPGVWVKLVDGSLLLCADCRVQRGVAQLTLLDAGAGAGEVKIGTKSIAWLRFKHQSDKLAQQWEEILAAPADGDLVVVRKDAALDFLEGEAGELDGESVQFKIDGETVPVKRTRLEGLVYFHAREAELPEPACRLTDAAGGHYVVRRLAWTPGQLELTTTAGARLSVLWQQVVALDFSLGKLVYLTDLEPERIEVSRLESSPQQSADTLKLLEAALAPRKDRAFGGGPLMLAGQSYQRGLALRSRTRLVFRLPGKFNRLRAVAGIDDADQEHGQVRLSIAGDGRVLFDAPIAGGQPPQELDLDLSGVKRLTILVDYGEQGDVGDFLDLCDARILK
jgi:hypothetical protein